MSFQNIKPFISHPDYWEGNTTSTVVTPAILRSPAGEDVIGVHVRRGIRWWVLDETNAVQLATEILNTIEASHQDPQVRSTNK